MMRRGDLATYPVEWVLRQAASERLSGGFEVHGATPVVVYLAAGDIYLAHASSDPVETDLDSLDDAEYEAAAGREETRIRAITLAAIDSIMGESEGWYYFNPIHQHPLRGSWRWPVEHLLDELRAAKRASGVGRLQAVGDPAAPAASEDASADTAALAPSEDASAEASSEEGAAASADSARSDGRESSAETVSPAPDPLSAGSPDGWLIAGLLLAEASPSALAARTGWERPRVEQALRGLARSIQAAGVKPIDLPAPAGSRPATTESPEAVTAPTAAAARGAAHVERSRRPAPDAGPPTSPPPPTTTPAPVGAVTGADSQAPRRAVVHRAKPALDPAEVAARSTGHRPSAGSPTAMTTSPEVTGREATGIRPAATNPTTGPRRIAEPLETPPRRPPVPPSLAVESRRVARPATPPEPSAATDYEDKDNRRVALRRLIRSMRPAS